MVWVVSLNCYSCSLLLGSQDTKYTSRTAREERCGIFVIEILFGASSESHAVVAAVVLLGVNGGKACR